MKPLPAVPGPEADTRRRPFTSEHHHRMHAAKLSLLFSALLFTSCETYVAPPDYPVAARPGITPGEAAVAGAVVGAIIADARHDRHHHHHYYPRPSYRPPYRPGYYPRPPVIVTPRPPVIVSPRPPAIRPPLRPRPR